MILTSSGIVLSTVRYTDSSVIARVYTEAKGLRSFMVRTGKGKNALQKTALLQPLSLIEVSFSDDERKKLPNLRSIERDTALTTIPFNPVKTCIALFVSEIISRAIEEEEPNSEMFKFLKSCVLQLDDELDSAANFHLKFLVEFTRFLGFYPNSEFSSGTRFDLTEGEFIVNDPVHPYHLTPELSVKFHQLLTTGMSTYASVRISNIERRELLQKLIDYYRLHLDGMKEIKSHKVLEEVLS